MISDLALPKPASLFSAFTSEFARGVKAIGQFAYECFRKQKERRDSIVKKYAAKLGAYKIVSSNFLGRTHKTVDQALLREEFERVEAQLGTQRSQVHAKTEEGGSNLFLTQIHSAEATLASKVGSCAEMCDVAQMELTKELGVSTLIERYFIEGGDHAFLVIGRRPTSSLRDYRTWGEGCMIYDPWACDEEIVYYPASELEKKMKCVINQFEKEKYDRVLLRPLDLRSDQLVQSGCNITTSKDFEREMEEYPSSEKEALVLALKEFHAAKDKIDIAHKLLKLAEEYVHAFQYLPASTVTPDIVAVRILAEQLRTFLK